jgi:hypothetical protein
MAKRDRCFCCLFFLAPNVCHAERSSGGGLAHLTAESKHPYPLLASTGTTRQPNPPNADSCARSVRSSCPRPAFSLSLASKGPMHVIVRFPVHQSRDVVFRSESLKVMKLMLEDTLMQVSAEADVESAGKTAHDIDAVVAAIARHAYDSRLGRRLWLSGRSQTPESFPSRELRRP